MFDLNEEFSVTKNMSKEIKEVEDELSELKKNRLNYFKDIVKLLNNHREELREFESLQSYNYCECRDDEYYGVFNLHSNSKLSAKGLGIIEDITGCKFIDMYENSNNDNVYIFELERLSYRRF